MDATETNWQFKFCAMPTILSQVEACVIEGSDLKMALCGNILKSNYFVVRVFFDLQEGMKGSQNTNYFISTKQFKTRDVHSNYMRIETYAFPVKMHVFTSDEGC